MGNLNLSIHLLRRVLSTPEAAPMLFLEDDPAGKAVQCTNAVDPAKPSPRRKKARTKRNHEGEKVMSFAKVMDELAGLAIWLLHQKFPWTRHQK